MNAWMVHRAGASGSISGTPHRLSGTPHLRCGAESMPCGLGVSQQATTTCWLLLSPHLLVVFEYLHHVVATSKLLR